VLPEGFCVESVRRWAWSVAATPRGLGCLLVAHQTGTGTAWVIAPPGVRLRLGEPDTWRKQWRLACYVVDDPEELFIAIGNHVPCGYQEVTPQDVRATVPADLQSWVSRVGDRQLALADGFGRQDPRLPPMEAHVRAAARRYAEVAGAAECSRHARAEFEHAPADVPDTVDELLGRAAGQTRLQSVRNVTSVAAIVRRSPGLASAIASLGALRQRSNPENSGARPSRAGRVRACATTLARLRTPITMLAIALMASGVVSVLQGNPPDLRIYGVLVVLVGAFLASGARGRAHREVPRSLLPAAATPTRGDQYLVMRLAPMVIAAAAVGAAIPLILFHPLQDTDDSQRATERLGHHAPSGRSRSRHPHPAYLELERWPADSEADDRLPDNNISRVAPGYAGSGTDNAGGSMATIAFSPDRQTAAYASNGRMQIWRWNSESRSSTRRWTRWLIAPSSNTVYGLTFSRNGRMLASVSDDKTVRLWDVWQKVAHLQDRGLLPRVDDA
jgi:hypothetical protein